MIREIKYCWCGTIAEGRTDQCATHNAEDRKNARAAKKVTIVRQAMKVTPKRADQLTEYRQLSKEYLEAYPCCEVEGCHNVSVEVHHMGGRQNEDLLNTDLFLAVCKVHHHEITVNSKWAIENGYSVSRTV